MSMAPNHMNNDQFSCFVNTTSCPNCLGETETCLLDTCWIFDHNSNLCQLALGSQAESAYSPSDLYQVTSTPVGPSLGGFYWLQGSATRPLSHVFARHIFWNCCKNREKSRSSFNWWIFAINCLCLNPATGGIDHPMPRMRLSAAGQRTSMDGLPQIGGHYVLAFLQGCRMLMNVLVGLAKCGQGFLHILRRFFPCSLHIGSKYYWVMFQWHILHCGCFSWTHDSH